MLLAIAVVAHLLGFLSSIDAVYNARTSQGAIAWAAVLNMVPYVSVPAYWVLGRSRWAQLRMSPQSRSWANCPCGRHLLLSRDGDQACPVHRKWLLQLK